MEERKEITMTIKQETLDLIHDYIEKELGYYNDQEANKVLADTLKKYPGRAIMLMLNELLIPFSLKQRQ